MNYRVSHFKTFNDYIKLKTLLFLLHIKVNIVDLKSVINFSEIVSTQAIKTQAERKGRHAT